MCGLLGSDFLNEKDIRKGLETIKHRGKDASNVVKNESVVLGHNRLSIQDVNNRNADQPMKIDENIIIYNGELWNSMMTDKTLLHEYKMETDCDTELVLSMYNKDGEKFIKKLDGMFGFVIHDTIKKQLVIGRDFIGRIPIYLYKCSRGIVVASEIKAIHEALGRKTNKGEIKLVEPGSYYVYNIESKELRHEVYNVIESGTANTDRSEIISNIRRLIEEGVDNEMTYEVPLCTILSGGIDSTIITYLLSKRVDNLEAFVVSLGDNPKRKYDLYYARKTAEWLNIPLNEVVLTKDDIDNHIRETMYAIEDPDWKQISTGTPQMLMAREITKKGYKVVFGGEGSDEIFASYGHVFAWHYKDEDFIKERLKLVNNLHTNNLIRSNKSMMYGGTLEVRTPFLYKPFIDYCMQIHPDFKMENRLMKPLLREAFADVIPDEIRLRKKMVMQKGANTEFIKDQKDNLKEMFSELFLQTNSFFKKNKEVA